MSSVHTRPSGSAKPSNIALYRRLLFPSLPLADSPPPLLRNASPELNTELYDLIALALRAYIAPWWSKITRYDRELIPHVAVILAAVIRALEARVETADLAHLVYHALPSLLAQHYMDYRAAGAKLGTSYASGGAAQLPQLFHQLQGHMAIDAEGRIDSTYIRHTLDNILQACLPLEDYHSDAEHAIIREIIVKVLLNDVFPLLSQPWFVHKLLLDQLRSGPGELSTPLKSTAASPARSSGPSIHTLVVVFLSAVQYLSGLCLTLIHLYKQTVNIVRLVNAKPELSIPPEQRDYAASLLLCASRIANAQECAVPSAVFNLLEAVVDFFGSFLDRLLNYVLQTFILTEQRVMTAVKIAKQTLFPNGYPGPPPVIPTPEEQAIMKEQLVQLLEERMSPFVSNLILGHAPTNHRAILSALAPLSSPACNAHLVLLLFDLVVVTLFPELGASLSRDTEGDSSCSEGSLGEVGARSASLLSRESSSVGEGEGGLPSPLTP